MANNKSAKKRIKTTQRDRLRNKIYKSSVKTLTKKFLVTLEDYKHSKSLENKQKLTDILSLTYSLIDKATKKNIFHKNKAARKKSQLAIQLKNA